MMSNFGLLQNNFHSILMKNAERRFWSRVIKWCIHRSRRFLNCLCRIQVIGLLLAQIIESKACRCSRNSNFLATALVKSGGDNVKRGGSLSDGSVMWICQEVIAGSTGTGYRGNFQTNAEEFLLISEEQTDFSEVIGGCSVDRVTKTLSFPETSGAEGIFFKSFCQWVLDYISIRKEFVSYRNSRFKSCYRFFVDVWIGEISW